PPSDGGTDCAGERAGRPLARHRGLTRRRVEEHAMTVSSRLDKRPGPMVVGAILGAVMSCAVAYGWIAFAWLNVDPTEWSLNGRVALLFACMVAGFGGSIVGAGLGHDTRSAHEVGRRIGQGLSLVGLVGVAWSLTFFGVIFLTSGPV